MEKAPEPSHACIGEELPSTGWEYTILIMRKILIYANVRSRAASFGMRCASVPTCCSLDRQVGTTWKLTSAYHRNSLFT
jgi:hypothetical protein